MDDENFWHGFHGCHGSCIFLPAEESQGENHNLTVFIREIRAKKNRVAKLSNT
jgi:hypothetical protein